MKIKNILVPVDFSPPSRLAVNYGISLARKLRAKLTLLHVVESGATLIAGFPPRRTNLAKEYWDQALRMLSALVGPEDQDDLDLLVLMKSGEVKDEIFRTIADQHADVVVMGTHGRGLFGRWLIGSVTEAMLRKVSIPILTVCRSMQPLSFNRILFATDLSESSKRKFGFVLDLARTLRSDVTLLHVLEPVSVTYGGGEMAEYVNRHNAKEARAELDRLIPELTPEDIRIDAAVVDGSAAEEILKSAELNGADLIMITVQPKGIVERALLGTTAERVIREADVPVLSVPARATEGIGHKEAQETHKVL